MTNRTRFLAASLAVALLLGAGTLMTAGARDEGEPEPDSLYKYLSVFTEVLGLVRQAYVEETDVEDLLSGAFEGTADALDPFAVFVAPDEVERFLALGTKEVPESGLLLVKERGWVYVAGVVDGSAADLLDLRRGDLLSRVDGRSTRELAVWEIEERLVEMPGEAVPIQVIRRGETRELELDPSVTEETEPVQVAERDGVTILRVARFEEGTAEAVAEILEEQGDRPLLVDLRDVAAGDPLEAYRVADLFVDGTLGSLVRKGNTEEIFENRRPSIWSGDLVVTVERGTVGAAEVLASVLADGVDATVVGETTFGHAGRLEVVELSSGALLQLTGAYYAGPEGGLIDQGLEPTVEVSERTRTLREKDLTLDELILNRALDLLAEGDGELPEAA